MKPFAHIQYGFDEHFKVYQAISRADSDIIEKFKLELLAFKAGAAAMTRQASSAYTAIEVRQQIAALGEKLLAELESKAPNER